jgi:hypothetical protein
MHTSACEHRKSPRGWKSYALGAAVVATMLASTACGPSEADPDSKASDRPSVTSSAKPEGTTSAKPGGGTGGAEDGGENGDKDIVAACSEDALSVSAVKEPADSKETRHLLITVQNAGDKECSLYHYPHVRLGADAQSTVPVIEDSAADPGTPVTIAPGEEAYAALLVNGGARDEYEANSITLSLQGPTPGSSASGPIDVPMPVDTLYADDGQLVTYWTTAAGFALDFITSK